MEMIDRLGLSAVLLIQCCVLSTWYRVIRVSIRTWIFVDDACRWVLLPGEVLKLRNPGVFVLIRIVNDWGRLEDLNWMGLVPKCQRTIGKHAESKAEVLVNRSRIDHLSIGIGAPDFSKVYAGLYSYFWMIQHAMKHLSVAVQRHGLKAVTKVPVIMVEAHGDSACN